MISAKASPTVPHVKPKQSFFATLFNLLACQLFCLYRRMSKLVLHFLTKKCELERICANEKIESIRIRKIEKCLMSSKIPYLHNSIKFTFDARQENEEETVVKIMALKKIPRDDNINFLILMRDALMKINSHNRLIIEVETFREKKFSFENAQHAEILFKVWSSLKGADDKLESKITKRWNEIGFQGTDPSSDFRGMGLLGLVNLFHFVTSNADVAKSVYSKSLHPNYGYPFAIVGINITSWIHKLLLDGHLKTHFYNDSELLDTSKINLENFHRIYGVIFSEFERFWFVNEPNIMHFEKLTKKFNKLVTEKLSKDPHTIIQENFLGKTSALKVNQVDLKSCF